MRVAVHRSSASTRTKACCRWRTTPAWPTADGAREISSMSPLPRCDVVTASFSLHHIASGKAKGALYKKCFAALTRGGVFVNADCCPSSNATLQARDRASWHQPPDAQVRARRRRTLPARVGEGGLLLHARRRAHAPSSSGLRRGRRLAARRLCGHSGRK